MRRAARGAPRMGRWGGPTQNATLMGAGAADELFLPLAPKIQGGRGFGTAVEGIKGGVGFGAAEKHCSFFLMDGSTVESHKAELKGYDTSKGALRFPPDTPLPAALVRKVVKARIAETEG